MKILFSISYYLPYTSGVSVYAQRLAQLLVKDHSCTILCMQHEPNLPSVETVDQIEIRRVKPDFFVSKGAISLSWWSESWKTVSASDVVFVHLPQFEGWITAIIAKTLGKKVFSIYHCDVNLAPGIFNKIVEKILDLANYFCLVLSNKIVAYTLDYANNSRLLPMFNKKIEIILPPIDIAKIDQVMKTSIAKKIGKADFVIGVAARLSAEKGIEYLLKAVPFLEKESLNFRIAIVGPNTAIGEEKYATYIKDLAKNYGNRVLFLDAIAASKMPAFYKNLQVLVLPSVNSTESFGLVQVEAILCGIPVIATDLPGVRVPVKLTGSGIIVRPTDSAQLAEAILKIHQSYNIYRPGAKARVLFSLENTKKAYEHLLLS